MRLKYSKVREYGRHGNFPIFGFVEHDPGFAFDGKPAMGLTLTDHFIYGGLRSIDGLKYFSFIRHFNNQGALGFSAFEADIDECGEYSNFRFKLDSKKAYLGAAQANQKNGVWGVRDLFDGRPRFEVRAWTEGASWYERDLVDLSGEAAGTVSQICNPDFAAPLVYNSRCIRVQGVFLGLNVDGWLQMDNAFLPNGGCWFNSDYHKGIQAASTNFATEYEDGAIDHGTMICGRENYNTFCVESSDRDPIVVIAPDIEIQLDDNEYPIRVSVDAGGGEVWEWRRLPGDNAKIPSSTMEKAPRWIQGRFARRGETRKVVSADGWLECYKHSLDQRCATQADR